MRHSQRLEPVGEETIRKIAKRIRIGVTRNEVCREFEITMVDLRSLIGSRPELFSYSPSCGRRDGSQHDPNPTGPQIEETIMEIQESWPMKVRASRCVCMKEHALLGFGQDYEARG